MLVRAKTLKYYSMGQARSNLPRWGRSEKKFLTLAADGECNDHRYVTTSVGVSAVNGAASVGQGKNVERKKIVQGREVEKSQVTTASERKGLIRLAKDNGHVHRSGQSCHPCCM